MNSLGIKLSKALSLLTEVLKEISGHRPVNPYTEGTIRYHTFEGAVKGLRGDKLKKYIETKLGRKLTMRSFQPVSWFIFNKHTF